MFPGKRLIAASNPFRLGLRKKDPAFNVQV